jgi:DNA-binding beta-propeller fold protein YncE
MIIHWCRVQDMLDTWIEAWGRAAVVATLGFLGAVSASSQSLVLAQTIDLPGVSGRIDHLDIDLEGGRLFVAALAAGSLEVIDLRMGKRIARLTPLSEPQGVAYLPAQRRVVVASGGSGRVEAYESAPAAIASVGSLDDADNVRFDARANLLFVGYGHALAILDLQTLAITRRIELPGHPEAFELESSGRRIFVNVPSAGRIAVIDRQSGTIASTWPVTGATGNFPMALDDSSNRLYVATRRPALFQAYDTTTGKRVGELPICADADDLFFDVQRRQLYAVCGQGVVDVLRGRVNDRYEVVDRIETAPGARTGLFVPSLSTLFVAVPARVGTAAQIRAYTIK